MSFIIKKAWTVFWRMFVYFNRTQTNDIHLSQALQVKPKKLSKKPIRTYFNTYRLISILWKKLRFLILVLNEHCFLMSVNKTQLLKMLVYCSATDICNWSTFIHFNKTYCGALNHFSLKQRIRSQVTYDW